MKTLAWFVACLLGSLTAMAQYDYFSYENGRFQSEMTVYVYEEECMLKSRPGPDGADILTLKQGDRLLVLYCAMVETERNGVIQYWYQVEYQTPEGVTTGYVKGHDLALGALTFMIDYKRDLLLFRIFAFNPSEAYTLQAKVLRNGQTLKSITTPFIDFHLNPTCPDYSIAVLKNIQARIDEKSEVAEISFFHSRTDMPLGVLYLIWNGENLDRICETMYLKEPGLFEYDSYIVYPGREGVKAGTVKQVEIIREFDEEKEEYVVVEKIETLYVWDGVKISITE